MRYFSAVWLVAGCILVAGCSAGEIPKERLALDYLDDQALLNPNQELIYSKVQGEFVHDFIKGNKDKAVRWTVTIIRVENEMTYELQEPLLPGILVGFTKAPQPALQAGQIITISGVLAGYGETFGKDPLWVVKPARLEEATEKELKELEMYQNAAKQVKEEADQP